MPMPPLRGSPSTTPLVVTGKTSDLEIDHRSALRRVSKRTWVGALAGGVALGVIVLVAGRGSLFGGGSDGTLRATAKQAGVKVRVDGKPAGILPVELKNLTAGEHSLEFSVDDHYSTEKMQVAIGPNEIREIAPVSLKVLRGLAKFDVQTEGATLTLISGEDRRLIADPSRLIEVDTAKPVVLEISKPGYQTVRQALTFEDSANKTFVVDVGPKDSSGGAVAMADTKPGAGGETTHVSADMGTSAPSRAPAAKPEPHARAEAAPKPEPAPKPEAAPKAAGGSCSLNFNSLPPSKVILDGKPLGTTPRLNVSVPAGSHTVSFVGTEKSKNASASCSAGEKKTVAIRL